MFAKIKILCTLIILGIPTLLSAQPERTTQSEPDYQQVFPEGQINTLKLTMSQKDWATIQNEMKGYFGTFGSGSMAAGKRPGPKPPTGNKSFPPAPPLGMQPRARPGKPTGAVDIDPSYVAVNMDYNGKTMQAVGFRLKGNSSLSSSWAAGTYKLPFRLNLKKYNKQSLYGFQELSLSPAFEDASMIREKMAYDLFRAAGVPSPQTTFCKVFIDFGNGSKYCGLYTMVEVVDDTMIKSQFGEDKGNIYKPESTFSNFAVGDFEKKNNKKSADWSDVEAAITVLNHSIRKSDPALWRKELEEVFNMDVFIRWLAMNTLISSWDSYGNIPHNYYLYNSPDKKLTWIPWDQNESMNLDKIDKAAATNLPSVATDASRRPSGMRPGPGPSKNGIDITLHSVGNQWSLIKAVAEDPVYDALYKNYVLTFSKTLFSPKRMDIIIDQQAKLIDQAVAAEKRPYSQLTSYQFFLDEIKALKLHVRQRSKATETLQSSPVH